MGVPHGQGVLLFHSGLAGSFFGLFGGALLLRRGERDLKSGGICLGVAADRLLLFRGDGNRGSGRVRMLVSGYVDLVVPSSIEIVRGNFNRVDLLEQFQHAVQLGHEFAVLLMACSVDAIRPFHIFGSFENCTTILTLESFLPDKTEHIEFRPFVSASQANVLFPFFAWCILSFNRRGQLRNLVLDRVDYGM